MKSAARPYFSAYPLKVVEDAAASAKETVQSPYLRALLAGQSKTTSRFRVTPMKNPYTDTPVATPARRIHSGNSMQPEGGEWFNHYE